MTFTVKQRRIMQFIQRFQAVQGISPTMEEIARHFGVTKITIYEHLNQLTRKGALKREKFRARSIELLVKVEERQEPFVIPILDGHPSAAKHENGKGEKTLDLTQVFPLGKQCFAFQVRGDSMIGDQIKDGDYVIVERRSSAHSGDMVVVQLADGRATLKRFFREKARLRSKAAREVDIQGVVIGLLRNFSAPERN